MRKSAVEGLWGGSVRGESARWETDSVRGERVCVRKECVRGKIL